ncbi:MAG TPA: hypothetical protein VF586_20495 [Pyrinomonadaceae bacterium]|jgi:hypothetical protein
MGIPLDVFSLYRVRGAGCEHRLLLRVGRPEFSNADEGDFARAAAAADEKARALLELYERQTLAAECDRRHARELAGELQGRPVGDELAEGAGGADVELWVAETRFGHPWVVLGTAASEEEFWRALGEDEDLSGLGARRPARRERVFFLAERVTPER